MSTAVSARLAGRGPGRVTQLGVIRSEWIKLRSLRSTWFCLLAAVVITDGLAMLFGAAQAYQIIHGGDPKHRLIFGLDATQVSLSGVFLAQLAIGVLGVLVITGEYSTGMIRSSVAAVPRRYPLLVAKSVVFSTVTFAVSLLAAFVGFLLGQQTLMSTHLQATLSTPGAVRAIFGAAVYLALIGLLAVGIGFLVRNTPAAIAALFAIVLVLPLLTNTLPTPYSTDVAKFLPLNAGGQIIATSGTDPNLLGPWAGIGVTAVYAAVALVAGLFVLNRRDA